MLLAFILSSTEMAAKLSGDYEQVTEPPSGYLYAMRQEIGNANIRFDCMLINYRQNPYGILLPDHPANQKLALIYQGRIVI